MKSSKYFVMMLLAMVSLGGMIASCAVEDSGDISGDKITNFEQCEAAGNPVMESYPRRCNAGGQTFTEEKSGGENWVDIATPKGTLRLEYSDGEATLSGMFERSTPCTQYEIDVISTRDLPISRVSINIFDSNKEVVCIQMIGEPQPIKKLVTMVSKDTKYTITYEQTEKLFEGKIGEQK